MPQLYFASPLFTEMEVAFNQNLAQLIRQQLSELTVYLPQEQADINDKTAYADSKMIAQYDTDQLLKSDIVLAVLDGQVIDPGVASEIGIAYQAKIPIVGLYTDSRQQGGDHPDKLKALQEIGESQFPYLNLYTVGLIKLNGCLVNQSQEVIPALRQQLNHL